tara:strand:+ start:111 stop:257 length:147 start_codon:yes stop_codon:yes gene_type:complete
MIIVLTIIIRTKNKYELKDWKEILCVAAVLVKKHIIKRTRLLLGQAIK